MISDPPCWGESGLPLLPPQWCPLLPDIELDVRSRRRGRGRSPLLLPSLCSAPGWAGYAWSSPPLSIVAKLIGTLLDDGHDPGFMDFPLLSRRIGPDDKLPMVPFLVSTWETLESTFDDPHQVTSMLESATALELYQVTGSLRTVLDVAVTGPSWLDDSYRRNEPTIPDSIDDAFYLAGIRHLRATGIEQSYTEPDSGWCLALTGRAGFTPNGQITLEAAGELAGVTRERVRQVTAALPLKHSIRRRWPLSQGLDGIAAILDDAPGRAIGEIESQLSSVALESGPLRFKAAQALLGGYGRFLDLCVDQFDCVRRLSELALYPEIGGVEEVRRLIWELSAKTGFLREDDLRRELWRGHPDLDDTRITEILDTCVADERLTLGYLFFTPHDDPTVFGTIDRMFAWAERLSVADIHEGITRRFKYRQLPPPPPESVLRSLLDKSDNYDVGDDDTVAARSRQPPDPDTVATWIGNQILGSPYGVLHRSTIFDASRHAGQAQGSVSVYMQLGEMFKAVGQGCLALVGTNPSPDMIYLAHDQARMRTVPGRVSAKYPQGKVRLDIIVSTHLRDSGVVSVTALAHTLLGDRRFTVQSELGSHGHLKISTGHLLYGFAPVLNALDVMPGDTITVDIDLVADTAIVALGDGQAE